MIFAKAGDLQVARSAGPKLRRAGEIRYRAFKISMLFLGSCASIVRIVLIRVYCDHSVV